ncbi:restriction endonuclease subunit S [Methyloceanibacter sp.]|uniref:restriction endonuclease subunit S n=1 Tax=Methyloceanibacter sp. TaxID=1965321 RepID=UPI002BAD2857|nr:restriction endonuclease subunit S [Methyloceanibacter sp.]HML91103.1 restriction endonuclease subunit S [Methyloceanibacter sp.]
MTTCLPETWVMAPLDSLGVWRGGGTPSKGNGAYWKGSIPWVSPKDMKVFRLKDALDHITEEALNDSAAKLIPENSVLVVTRSGILAHTFPVAINAVPVTVNQDLKALTPYAGIDAEFVAWVLHAFQREILDVCSKDGTTVHSIEMPRLQSFEIPIPPTNEQKRIVEKLEELFSKIDEGERCLSAIAPIANSALGLSTLLRHSILKQAFSGRLVAHDPNDEPAPVMLEKIKTSSQNHNKKNAKEVA